MDKFVRVAVFLFMAILSCGHVSADVVTGKIKNITYEISNDTLYFSGEGKLPVIHADNGWLVKYSIGIHHIVIGEGITEVNAIGGALATRRVARSNSGSNYVNEFESGLPNVRSITLPSTLKKIGANSFVHMRIESICLPEGLEEIGRESFAFTNLNFIRFPESLKKVGYQAFSSCRNLFCVDFNCAKVNIGSGCFFASKVLRMLLHGNNVVSITTDAFKATPFEKIDENTLLDALHTDGLEQYINLNIVPRNEFTGNDAQYERLREKLVNDYYESEYKKAEVVLKLDTFTCGRYNRKTGILPLHSTNFGSFEVPIESFELAAQFSRMLPELISSCKAQFEPTPDGDRINLVAIIIPFNGLEIKLNPL